MAFTVLVDYVNDADYAWGSSHCQWLVCVETSVPYDNAIYVSCTKPTARQLRQWKKRAKREFAKVKNSVYSCSCFECMNRRGLA